MKTHINKIFLIAAAILFFSAGISFAHDWKPKPDSYNSRWHARGQFHKAPVYRSPNYRAYYYGHKRPGYATRYYYRGPYYPKKKYWHHNYYRHYQKYPSRNTFFFGFSVR